MALSKGKKAGIIAILFTTIALAIGGALVAIKAGSKDGGKTPNLTPPDNQIVNPTPDNPIVNPTPTPTPDNPIVTPDPTPDPEPDVPVIEQKTEAEYKAMFEADLPGVIESDFNKNITKENLKIKNAEVLAINNLTGCAYVKCERNGANRFYEFTSELLKGQDSFKSLYENLDSITFEHNSPQTVQEKGLANEIAEFAFEQAEVQNYLSENGLNANDLKVLNATEFEGVSGGYRKTEITLISDNNLFKVNLIGVTGSCSTQEEYLNKMKNGRLDNIEISSPIKYKELETKDAVSYNFKGTASAEQVSYQIVAKHKGQTYVIGEGLDY